MSSHQDDLKAPVDKVMSEPSIKSKIILPAESDPSHAEHIRQATPLDLKIEWQALDREDYYSAETDLTGPDTHTLKRKRWIGKFIACLSVMVLVLSFVELGLFIRDMYLLKDWISGLWLGVGVSILVLLIGAIYSEWRGLRRLKKQSASRQTSKDLYATPAIGLAKQHCVDIADTLPPGYENAIALWQQSIDEHHTDKEVLSLFEQQVIAKVDQAALAKVMRNAGASSVMIAVSPFALLDMAIVLWRNIRMMQQVSEVYGVHLGYWGRVALIRQVFHSMLYAGAAEIISDAGNYALGASLTGKLSTRIAQGMGAGVLTARIGLNAIHSCRPLPWLSVKRPGLNQLSKKILTDLHKQLK
ncbi:YcjF family protein [Paraglaciecola sp. L1A13]|uniref:YcjF family protein n=1 Tax=Paraglaciecola sp. L1A13 TaxID=2686359 RepID=UPI00131DC076|nr:TIGR01620 family protein [Paraglaciecola sp. L1A13]